MCAQRDADLPQVAALQVHLLTLVTPQVLRLESRVLELELHRKRAAPAEADAEHRQVPAQELGCKANGQGQSDRRRLQVTMSSWRAWQGGLGGS